MKASAREEWVRVDEASKVFGADGEKALRGQWGRGACCEWPIDRSTVNATPFHYAASTEHWTDQFGRSASISISRHGDASVGRRARSPAVIGLSQVETNETFSRRHASPRSLQVPPCRASVCDITCPTAPHPPTPDGPAPHASGRYKAWSIAGRSINLIDWTIWMTDGRSVGAMTARWR